MLFVCLGDFHAPPGVRQTYAFARALADAGHRTRVLVGGDPATIAELGDNFDQRVEVGRYRLRRRSATAETLAAAAAFSPDVVHLYEPRHVPATAALAIAEHVGAPLFVRFADDDRFIEKLAGGSSVVRRAGKAALRVAGHVVPGVWPFTHPSSQRRLVREAAGFDAISPALAAETGRRLGRPCRTILPAVPVAEPPPARPDERSRHGLPEDARIVLFAGSVFRSQFADFEILLRAFALLAARRLDVHLVQTGRIAERYTPELLAGLLGTGAGRFHPLGFLPTENDVMRLMAASDVLVQPGAPTDFNRYRLPAKLHDYLASGRPVVTYAAGFDELLRDGVDAILTRTDEPAELADAIDRVLGDPDLERRLAENGRARALELFAPARAASALVEYYGVAEPSRPR